MPDKILTIGIAKGKILRPEFINWGPWKIILIAISILTTLIAVSQLTGSPDLHSNWPEYISAVTLTWLLTYFLCSYAQFKSVYLFTSAYIIPLCLFHLGIVIPHALGINLNSSLISGSLAPWLERAGWYTVLSLGCLGIGFGISLKKSNFKMQRFFVNVESANKALARLYQDGIGLLIASGVFLGMAIASFGNLLNYSRVDFFRLNAGDTRGLGAFTMVLPVALIFLVIGSRNRKQRIFTSLLALACFFAILLSGTRSGALFPLLIGTILWVKVGRRIPLPVALSTLAFVLIAIPAIGLLRDTGQAFGKIEQDDIMASARKAKVENAFTEMGQTGAVLAHILRLVPETDPYRYGQSYIYALKDSIPNIGFSQNQSERLKAKSDALINHDATLNLIPSDWITYRLDPVRFAAGEGIGFSGIGEPYINFGLSGVVFFFILLGFLLGRLESVNLLNHPRYLIFSGIALWPLIPLVRNDVGNFTKPVVFTFIVLLIWRLIIKFLPRR